VLVIQDICLLGSLGFYIGSSVELSEQVSSVGQAIIATVDSARDLPEDVLRCRIVLKDHFKAPGHDKGTRHLDYVDAGT
jgi:hypothetical protein